MDKEEDDLQHLGFFGACRESIIIIYRYPKVFLQITLALLLPLAFLFLAYTQLSQYLLSKIQYGGFSLYLWTQNNHDDLHQHILVYWLIIRLTYFILLLGFSIFSTSGVVYIVASIHAGKETDVDLRTVVRFIIASRVWMKVMVTLVINFVMVFCYSAVTGYLKSALWVVVERKNVDMGTSIVLGVSASMIYLASLVYINVVWQLAGTISVLDDESFYGFRALVRSWALLKGKMVSAFAVFVLINLLVWLVVAGFGRFVVSDRASGSCGVKVVYGVLSLLALSAVFLFGLVVETVFYLVCNSYHHERVDKSYLAERLTGCLVRGAGAEYESLNLQMEKA